MEKKYIVISISKIGTQKWFNGLIECNEFSIVKYIEDLKFKADVLLCFYSIQDLVDSSFILDLPAEYVEMNQFKTLSDFKDEVGAMLDKLEIKNKTKKNE